MSTTDLAAFIATSPLIDSHEHLRTEHDWLSERPDVLRCLFDNYVLADLRTAGATLNQVDKLIDPKAGSVAERFNPIATAWRYSKHTGYGEAVRLIARHVYGIEEITPRAVEDAATIQNKLLQPGGAGYFKLLRDQARLDHVQVDDFIRPCAPDASEPMFVLNDINWHEMSKAIFKPGDVSRDSGVEIRDIDSLRDAIETIFDRYGPIAVALKSQHAYERTLLYEPRTDADAAKPLAKMLAGESLGVTEKLCLGDWCLARGVEQAIKHKLPVKIHTGYYAGNSHMHTDRIRPGHLCKLLLAYPAARFVLMHIGYPYEDEMVALGKHFLNVWVDFCWAWSIDPYSARHCVRKLIHAVPTNRVFGFGGDTFWPTAAYAYSLQARAGLTRALQAEVDDGLINEADAIEIARRYMLENQRDCFDIEGKRSAIVAASAATR
ncbi:MAG: amidohydrolase family protein [Phycisphaerales bacterium]